MDLKTLLAVMILSGIFAFVIAFPIIYFLYKFKITRRMSVDLTSIIEKRNLKVGVPIMGGLIIIITVIVLNLTLNPYRANEGLLLILFIFVLSAFLGGFDDILNIYGVEREKPKSISRVLKLIKVHKSTKKKIAMFLTLPWTAYKSFFYMLGSNPGKGIQAHEKILVQSVAGILLGIALYFFTPSFDHSIVNIPIFNLSVSIGILLIPFAWITVVLMSNAVNLADGMDTLAASQLIFSFAGFFLIAVVKNDVRIIFLCATAIGALASYLYFNIPPARFQMGDVGSLSLGTLLASVAFLLGEPLMLLIISLPFAATLLSAVIQGIGRRVLGRRIFRMAPLHYHFQMAYNWSEEKVAMRFSLFSLFCAVVGVFIYLL